LKKFGFGLASWCLVVYTNNISKHNERETMNTETYETITFSDIEKGDVIQMKRPGQSRFSKRVAVVSAWDHHITGRVYEGMRPKDGMFIESMDGHNEFRRIILK
jgi:hypothetical protein